MFKLDSNPVKARRQIEEAKIITRRLTPGWGENPSNPSIPKGYALTGRQMYYQFCYRMSKFDEEMASLDPIMAQSWLNIGMTRLVHEFEKRLVSDAKIDRSVWPVFNDYCNHYSLTERTDERAEGLEYIFDHPWAIHAPGLTDPAGLKLLDDNLLIYVSPIDQYPDLENTRLPDWWPYEKVDKKWKGKSLQVDYNECEEKDLSFLTSNSFSNLRCGTMMKPWVRREASGFPIHIYVDSEINRMRGLDSFTNRSALPPNAHINQNMIRFQVDKVVALFYDIGSLMDEAFVKTDSDSTIKAIPNEYCNDVVDYGIDAYFESMYQHNFGRYVPGTGRQDAAETTAAAPKQNKTDAVPPQRYQMQG